MLLLVAFPLFCQTNIKVGDPAPDINITEWLLNIPKDTSLSGKYIVLEFWATWCHPCLEAVPHMNKLRQAFPQEDLYFISITDESPEQAATIFDKVDFQSIVVTDEYEETQRNFGNGSTKLSRYPFTVLIDASNTVRWTGSPFELTEDELERFLTEDYVAVEVKPGPEKNKKKLGGEGRIILQDLTMEDWFEALQDSTIVWSVYISEIDELPNITEGMRSVWGSGREGYTTGNTLREIFQWVFPEQKLVLPLKYESRLYAFYFIDKTPDKDSPKRVRYEMFKQLGLSVEETMEKGLLHVITLEDHGLLEPGDSKLGIFKVNDYGVLVSKKTPLMMLAQQLVAHTDDQWVFRGKDKKKYYFEIDLMNRETTISDLERYGLKVKSRSAKIPVVRVSERR